jgi:MinD-like ATPase involved in chromosome partitioning or flagellar assembly
MADKSNSGLLSALKLKRERGIVIRPKIARVIGVFSCKGGVGKTTTAVNIAAYFSKKMGEDNVLAVDANLTAPNLGLHLGELSPKFTIHDVIAEGVPIQKAVTKCRGMYCVLGSIGYREQVHFIDLKSVLDPLKEKYKLMIIDSAPGIGGDVVAAMKACDEVIIVSYSDLPTVASTLKTFHLADMYKVHIIGVVLNRILGEPYELSVSDVKEALGWPIIAAVPEDPKVRESTSAGTPIVMYAPKSPAAREFMNLGEYLTKYLSRSQ